MTHTKISACSSGLTQYIDIHFSSLNVDLEKRPCIGPRNLKSICSRPLHEKDLE